MASEKIIFFDIPTKAPRTAWSFNPWRTRFILNYKGLDYETEWLEYPEIKPRLQNHVPPREIYTVPTILMPDGTYVTDSREIAKYLEEKYPSPSLHLDSPYIPKITAAMIAAHEPLRPIFVPLVPKRFLDEASHPFWYRTREETVGMSLDEYAKQGGDAAFDKVIPGLQAATALLKEKPEGPYFNGNELGYADFLWAGILIFWQKLGDDVFEELLKRAGDRQPHLDLLEALKPLSAKND
ncbi:hypothetical protein B0H63DRAFT_456588 [Podospora didyma]|uniref:GST N-terminal domain-containing protein n=1 Tax=Podospora didyma TaxID=330526 RepID=A0AAE0P3Z2_9PEZI|nr:hypothetical protein B0H63DRAFT_456588 [Podospora didyma]